MKFLMTEYKEKLRLVKRNYTVDHKRKKNSIARSQKKILISIKYAEFTL